jgi:urease beta subunit
MSDLSIGGGVRLPEPSRGNRATQVGSTQHFTGGNHPWLRFFRAPS